MKRFYINPTIEIMMVRVASVICASKGVGQGTPGDGDFAPKKREGKPF